MSAGLKANADGSAAIQVGGSDAITITSGLNTTFVGTVTSPTGTLYPLVSGTAVTASGTSVDFTGIPSTAKRITVMFNGISTNGSSTPIVRLGDSGGIETTGYVSAADDSVTIGTTTIGFLISGSMAAANTLFGCMTINLIGSNIWVAMGNLTSDRTGGNVVNMSFSGGKTLSDVLTQVRITTVNGTDTFDAGSINIMWE